MKNLEFFKRNKKSKTELVKTKKPSPEQILFAETALKIISPTVEKFGFVRNRTEIKQYSMRYEEKSVKQKKKYS